MADPTSAPSLAESIDASIANFFASHNPLTYLLLLIITGILVYPLIVGQDPDIHPFLLARQSSAAPIRNPKESPVYRALDVPHGYPLRNALGVKDIGAPKWTSGRRGDLRDVLARAVSGPLNAESTAHDGSKVGKVWTLSGKDKSTPTEMKDLMRMVNALGSFAKDKVGADGKVAVCLSNSVELLASIFAAAFYDYEVTVIPTGLAQDQTDQLLAQTNPNILIAEAGELDLTTALPKSGKSLKELILIAKPDSKHMDWASTPTPKGVSVTTWDDLLSSSSATSDIPTTEKDAPKPKALSTFTPTTSGSFQLTTFTSDNLIAGTAALLTSLPRTQPLTSSDTLLPTTSIAQPYTLTWILAALYSNASIALNSVSGSNVDLFATTASFQPTILVTSPGTLQKYLTNYTKTGLGASRFTKFFHRRSLRSGIMPSRKPIPDLGGGKDAVFLVMELAALSKLRAVFVGHDTATDKQSSLTSSDLDTLRTELGVKISYALTSGQVAGAVAQGNLHDYRDKGPKVVCVGAPAGSVEVKLVGEDDGVVGKGRGGEGSVSLSFSFISDRANQMAQIVVNGPAVAGEKGEVQLDVKAKIDTDHTLVLL
jgi:acyl-CoA synthetase (AMP-forming)/AMP-acid ligase II